MKRRLTLVLAGALLLALLAAGAAAAAPARTCTFTPSLVATVAAGDYVVLPRGTMWRSMVCRKRLHP